MTQEDSACEPQRACSLKDTTHGIRSPKNAVPSASKRLRLHDNAVFDITGVDRHFSRAIGTPLTSSTVRFPQ